MGWRRVPQPGEEQIRWSGAGCKGDFGGGGRWALVRGIRYSVFGIHRGAPWKLGLKIPPPPITDLRLPTSDYRPPTPVACPLPPVPCPLSPAPCPLSPGNAAAGGGSGGEVGPRGTAAVQSRRAGSWRRRASDVGGVGRRVWTGRRSRRSRSRGGRVGARRGRRRRGRSGRRCWRRPRTGIQGTWV